MTPEAALWQRVKPGLGELGKAVRLENAAAESVPDVVVVCPRGTLWIELKIAKGHRVRMPKFQHIFAREIAAISPDWVWMLLIYHGDLCAIQYVTIQGIAPCKNEKYVEYDVRSSYKYIVPNVTGFFSERIK